MKTMKKFLSGLLAVAMIASLAVTACADSEGITQTVAGDTSTVPVKLTTTAATFSVTVPTQFPVNVASDGTVTCADNLKIVNHSKGQIKVTSVKVSGQNDWKLVDYTTDFTKKAADTKEFGFQIMGDNVPTSGDAVLTHFTVINGAENTTEGTSLNIPYKATIAVQSTAISEAEIATVVFTIGWNNTTSNP